MEGKGERNFPFKPPREAESWFKMNDFSLVSLEVYGDVQNSFLAKFSDGSESLFEISVDASFTKVEIEEQTHFKSGEGDAFENASTEVLVEVNRQILIKALGLMTA